MGEVIEALAALRAVWSVLLGVLRRLARCVRGRGEQQHLRCLHQQLLARLSWGRLAGVRWCMVVHLSGGSGGGIFVCEVTDDMCGALDRRRPVR